MPLGLTRLDVLLLTGLTRNKLYYKSTGNKPGKRITQRTRKRNNKTGMDTWVLNEEVVKSIIEIRNNKDLPNYYRLICARLKLDGYYINHKKVYRLEKENGLLAKAKKKSGRKFVKFRRVNPLAPLRIIEMDIKYVWIAGKNTSGYVLTIIYTFTRYVLHWTAGYIMRKEQVKQSWDYVIMHYFQQTDMLENNIEVEVRNDNGKQFNCKLIENYFKDNYMNQVFTHPYSPEENGHVESFHKTLSTSTKNERYKDLLELEVRLNAFYRSYNNDRPHSSIAGLTPSLFWSLWDKKKITMIEHSKRRAQFKLNMPYQEVNEQIDVQKYKYPISIGL